MNTSTVRSRRKSFCPEPPKTRIRRTTNFMEVCFEPDFQEKIFTAFQNSYSKEFKEENQGIKDDWFGAERRTNKGSPKRYTKKKMIWDHEDICNENSPQLWGLKKLVEKKESSDLERDGEEGKIKNFKKVCEQTESESESGNESPELLK